MEEEDELMLAIDGMCEDIPAYLSLCNGYLAPHATAAVVVGVLSKVRGDDYSCSVLFTTELTGGLRMRFCGCLVQCAAAYIQRLLSMVSHLSDAVRTFRLQFSPHVVAVSRGITSLAEAFRGVRSCVGMGTPWPHGNCVTVMPFCRCGAPNSGGVGGCDQDDLARPGASA